jgi:hypothetical protein
MVTNTVSLLSVRIRSVFTPTLDIEKLQGNPRVALAKGDTGATTQTLPERPQSPPSLVRPTEVTGRLLAPSWVSRQVTPAGIGGLLPTLWLSLGGSGACGLFLGNDGAWRAAAGLEERWHVAVVEVDDAVTKQEALVVFPIGPSVELHGASGQVRREKLLRWCTSVYCLPAARVHEGQI